jgi:lipopolysaccharide export system protein LptC
MTGTLFERFSAMVSLGLLAGLAMTAWLLSQLALRPSWDAAVRTGGQMNAQVQSAEVLQTDASGKPKYRIQTPELSLFDDGRSEMRAPVLMALREDAPAVRARATRALVSADQNEIALEGDARIERQAYGKESEVRILTDWVRFDVSAQTAETTAPVRVNQGATVLTGVGMKFNQRTEQIEILSQTQMVLPSQQTTP